MDLKDCGSIMIIIIIIIIIIIMTRIILPYPLTYFEMQNYYQNESRFTGVYSGIRSSVKNLGEYSDIEIHWIALYLSSNKVTYFDSFGMEHMN